ncbi:MAG: copper amine oxidase N-terminal domain-containing protein [Candidatus Eremiobacteraeota bacterium]|nr:copper amine oxidase N-terminal domain-containing protein [Candidatus Eremiobacteraeota bacterium]
MISAQPAIRVAVNDRQLPVPAVMDHGRVLVPFRAVVEALGGSVSQFALPLPPPARVIAGRTYAPIRYLAQHLNAAIEYDARAHLVQVFVKSGGAPVAVASAAPLPTAPASGVAPMQPAANTRVGTAYPTVAAQLPIAPNAAIASLRLLLDGIDVTRDAHYAGTYVTYIPRTGLPTGEHHVVISGADTGGRPFSEDWSFETTTPAEADVATPGLGYGGYGDVQLNVFGSQFIGGAPMSVQLIAPPGGEAFAFVCTSSWRFPLYAAPTSQIYNGQIATARVTTPIDCPVTAMYVAANGAVTYAPYPVFVQLIPASTPAPAPTATPVVPTPMPSATRIPHPPVHRQTPAPTVTATPLPRPTPTPRVLHVTPHVHPTPATP